MSEGDLPDGTSEIFLRGGLDDPNHVESAHEFGLYAHAIWNSEGFASEAGAGKIHLIDPSRRARGASVFALLPLVPAKSAGAASPNLISVHSCMYLQTLYIHTPMTVRSQARKTLRTDAARLVSECAGCNSRLAARLITQFLDGELAPAGFTVAQLGLMAQIAASSDDTLGALARRTGLEQSTLSRNLRTLENEGLVEIAVVDGDLRRRMVWLTETGAHRLEAAIPVWRKAHARLAKQVSPTLAQRLAEAAQSFVVA
jgi:DNA-binding MarR family transcriptional regulator